MKRILSMLLAASFLMVSGLAMAQDAGTAAAPAAGTPKAHKMSPKRRLKRQHKRIKEGEKNGTIDKAEAKQLHQEGKDINNERKADLKNDGGKLTPADRKDLEKQEDQRSKEIKQDKTN